MSSADEIILHHYDASLFSEKIRLAFGLKNLPWRSVIISSIMPRPDLMPLTGGYRKTPVMQIGADIYCDTQCILRELERRFPEPTLYPGASEGRVLGDDDGRRPSVLPGQRRGDLRQPEAVGSAARLRRGSREAVRSDASISRR